MSEYLRTYATFAPTGFDAPGAFLPDRQDWYVLGSVGQTRDSGVLERSNFRVAVRSLAAIAPEGYEVHRFGHWGPGWFEIILIDPNNAAAVKDAEEMACALSEYPVLCESDWSKLEYETATAAWSCMGTRERIEVCRRYRVSIFAARRDDVPADPTGEMLSYLAE